MTVPAGSKFAKGTTVSVDSSFDEIRRTLKRYGADKLAFAESDDRVDIAFVMHGRRVRFTLRLPTRKEAVNQAGGQYGFKGDYNPNKHQQLIKERWRALSLVIKAKLESVESGIETFEESFMGQLILANGQTMAEWAAPQVEQLYGGDQMPPLLPSGQ